MLSRSLAKIGVRLSILLGLWGMVEPIATARIQTQAQAAQATSSQPALGVLEVGQAIEQELAGGQSHSYQITLTTGHYVHAVVEQSGIDVVVTVLSPAGKKLLDVDSPNGAFGAEPVYLLTEAAGTYRLVVSAGSAKARPGQYKIMLAALRVATSEDRESLGRRALAQKAYSEAEQLRVQGTALARRRAVAKYEEALSYWRSLNDVANQAMTLNIMGALLSALGETQKALDTLLLAQPLFHAVGDQQGEALTIMNIGAQYSNFGDRQNALLAYRQVLPLFRAAHNQESEATTLSNMGAAYSALGERQQAIDYYNQALALYRALGNRREAVTLSNLGVAYAWLGENQKALDHYNQALLLHRAEGNQAGEATQLDNMGVVYASLGELQKALDYHRQALTLRRAAGDQLGEALTLHDIGAVVERLGEKRNALTYQNQALSLFRQAQDREGEALTLAKIGDVHASLGEHQQAREYYDQALSLFRQLSYRAGEGNTLNKIGRAYASSGEPEKAIPYYNDALTLFRRVGYRMGEAETLASLARAERATGKLSGARATIEAALALEESLRTNIASQQLRSSYFATVQGNYNFYIDLLMRLHQQQPTQGYDTIALQAAERARARSLLESLAEAHANIREGVAPALLTRERTLQQRLNAKVEIAVRLRGNKDAEREVAALDKELDALTTEYQQVQVEIRQQSPRYAALTQPQPVTPTEMQQLLDPNTLLLEYAVGEEHSYLWAVSSTSLASYVLPKGAEIDTVARRFHEQLSANTPRNGLASARRIGLARQTALPDARATGAALSQMLLGPVVAQLGTKRLVIVGHGALQYVPFAALPEPFVVGYSSLGGKELPLNRGQPTAGSSPPLIVNHEIIFLPSASTLAVMRKEIAGRTPAPKVLAVLADPVFDEQDVRFRHLGKSRLATAAATVAPHETLSATPSALTRAVRATGLANNTIPRLPGTRKEAEQILVLAPQNARLQALDFAANRATATSDELSQYRIVHFATHGFLNSQQPELSGIVLSLVNREQQEQNGFLLAHEIYNLRLPAELVVLSACQTGLGKEIKGEGVVGLTRGFMYAGAPRVVVSLWNVNDRATAELMTQFYRRMLREGARPAAALRAAQLELWKQKQWAAPYYWAAFILQGEWR